MWMQWTSREKKMIYVIIALSILLISIGYALWSSSNNAVLNSLELQNQLLEPTPVEETNKQDNEHHSAPHQGDPEGNQQIIIDVKGAVQQPSIYTLTADQRVHDAIVMAGGVLEDASTKYINLAEKLVDGMVVYVPTEEEVEEWGGEMVVFSTPSGADSSPSSANSGKININLASQSELETLPGIGPSRAQQIIAYREEQGSFQRIEDMMNISGIGQKIFEGLIDLIDI